MKEYPSIVGSHKFNGPLRGLPCVAFDKLDGSNLRWEWTRKRSWHKQGTRTQLFDSTHPTFGCAIDIFAEKFANELEDVIKQSIYFKKFHLTKVIVFTEFMGRRSFAGQHEPDDPKTLTLFDVWINQRGLLGPDEFLELFGHLKVPEVIYRGQVCPAFLEDVRNGKYDVNEGVVIKGGTLGNVWMTKVKTLEYLDRLRAKYAEKWEQYAE